MDKLQQDSSLMPFSQGTDAPSSAAVPADIMDPLMEDYDKLLSVTPTNTGSNRSSPNALLTPPTTVITAPAEPPQLISLSPQQGQQGDVLTAILRVYVSPNSPPLPMRLVLDKTMVETTEKREYYSDDQITVTLATKVPSRQDLLPVSPALPADLPTEVSICSYDPVKNEARATFVIGSFQYLSTGSKRSSMYDIDGQHFSKKAHGDESADFLNDDSVDFDNMLSLMNPYEGQPSQGQSQQQLQASLGSELASPSHELLSDSEQTSYNDMLQQALQSTPPKPAKPPKPAPAPARQHPLMPKVSSSSSAIPPVYAYSTSPPSTSYYAMPSAPPPPSSGYADPSLSQMYMPLHQQHPQHDPHQVEAYQDYMSAPPRPGGLAISPLAANTMPPPSLPPGTAASMPLTPPLQQKQAYPMSMFGYASAATVPAEAVKETSPFAGLVSRPQLIIHGDLMEVTQNWSSDEWNMQRRVVRFWRRQLPSQPEINCGYEVVNEEHFRAEKLRLQAQGQETPMYTAARDSLVVSCIYWKERGDYFITSVDCIQLIEGLIGVEFTVEEKNRIRRNLEALKPLTAAKSKAESSSFFKLIMGFPAPKPRNIEKDVKVFLWSTLGPALKKIVGKYTPSYSSTASVLNFDTNGPPQPQLQSNLAPPSFTRG